MTDAIKVTVPRRTPYYGVVRLVLGGLAARLDVSYEDLEDLQLATETLATDAAYAAGDDVTVELVIAGGAVELVVGPVDRKQLESALRGEAEERPGVGLRRLLDAVVEGIELERRGGAEWVRLRKDVRRPGVAAPA